jgi:hypothetical protein
MSHSGFFLFAQTLNFLPIFFVKVTRSSSCYQESEACSQRQEYENWSEKFTALTEATGYFRILKSKTYFDGLGIVGSISKVSNLLHDSSRKD